MVIIAENRMGSKPGCENEVSLSAPLSFAPGQFNVLPSTPFVWTFVSLTY